MMTTTTTQTPTPTPWTLERDTDLQTNIVVRGEGLRSLIARSYDGWLCPEHGGTQFANAAHIVKCVNEREGLLDLLQQFVDKVAMWPEGSNPEFLPYMKQARSLLAQTEEA